MKVVTSKQMAGIEKRSYDDGYSEKDYMERAGKGVAEAVDGYIRKHRIANEVVLLCGKGNNGGDAYVAGCYLMQAGYKVLAYQVGSIDKGSDLCRKMCARFKKEGGEAIEIEEADRAAFPVDGVIVDALFGTGIHSAPREPFASLITLANSTSLPIISVDIPSGLDGDSGKCEGAAIRAVATVFLGLPKIGFFLREGWDCVGKLQHVDFGLPQKYIDEEQAALQLLGDDQFLEMLPKMRRGRHKYEAGYVVGLAGSKSMPGAALLSTEAALRGGAGIVRLLHPIGMEAELSSSMNEIIKMGYDPDDLAPALEQINRAAAVFVGPGLGLTEETRKLLRAVLPKIEKPCVIDADALNVLAEEKIPLPEKTVMTPHIGEMGRLLKSPHKGAATLEFLNECREYAEQKKVVLILKGGPSFIFHKKEMIVVNAHGDPGMATAGSGDVLTGLLAALIAQGLTPYHAALSAVYLHSVAGEKAAEEKTSYCMTASDITRHFPDVFRL